MPPRRRSRGKGATRQTKKGGVEKREAIKSKKVVVADDVGVDVKEHGKQRGVGQPLAPGPSSPPKYNPTSSELEKKRLQVADELRKVEQQVSCRSSFPQFPITCCNAVVLHWTQIYDLETKYLESSSAFGNAVRGKLHLCLFP